MLTRPEDKLLYWKFEIEIEFTRPRCMWKYNIKIYLTETGRGNVN